MQTNQQCPPQPSSTNPTPNLIFSQRVEANALSPLPPAPTPAGEGPFTFQSQATVPMRWPLHRRARSELAFRIPEDFDLCSGDPMVNGNVEEIVSEDDLFSTFMDIEKIGCKMEGSGSGSEGGLCRDWEAEISGAGDERKINNARDGVAATTTKPKHRHSNSMDGSSMSSSAVARGEGMFGEVLETKKAMTAEQLAELAAIDPKRAKRKWYLRTHAFFNGGDLFHASSCWCPYQDSPPHSLQQRLKAPDPHPLPQVLANRQSAARSKERKARYISELERKVQTLQTEATTLSAQLTLFQRDTTGLTAENVELKLRLQAMEQEAQIGDALNGALKHEVARLKIITGEVSSSVEANNVERLPIPFNPSFFATPQQQPSSPYQNIQLQPAFHQFTATNHHLLSRPPHLHTDMMQQDHLRRLQGLDISKGSLIVKSESSTVSASESSSNL
ncbi:hypothetical protein IEQ34_005348 [Dendrobium chrysotoxum]|uniref:BZIP domain-containing protein n=1 Tax=Dendrobium chrysotoxum TaxID=161865 RepID=A0AAV7HCR6_DENCH|nr:hypothetical protein IEQ34_005348 [Dendrobium chrysotoxum]